MAQLVSSNCCKSVCRSFPYGIQAGWFSQHVCFHTTAIATRGRRWGGRRVMRQLPDHAPTVCNTLLPYGSTSSWSDSSPHTLFREQTTILVRQGVEVLSS